MDECPTASAITRTLTPLVASFVINVRLPLCEDAPMIPQRAYKRFTRFVKAEVYDAAYQSRIVSVAISRKKKLAIDSIANVVYGTFV